MSCSALVCPSFPYNIVRSGVNIIRGTQVAERNTRSHNSGGRKKVAAPGSANARADMVAKAKNRLRAFTSF